MYAAVKGMVVEYNAQAVTLKCHFALSQELGLSACIPLSVIGNNVVASCEADIPLTLTQLAMHYLSGGEATTYADTHELTGEKVLWGACGFAPADMCIDGKIICEVPQGESGGLGDTFGDYITNKNHLKAGRLTAARILKEASGEYTLHAVAGDAAGDIGKTSEFGAPQYAFTEMQMDADFDKFAQNLGSHHYALVYADLLEELEMYCNYKNMKAIIER
jgi:L-fucose isomerase-like protein